MTVAITSHDELGTMGDVFAGLISISTGCLLVLYLGPTRSVLTSRSAVFGLGSRESRNDLNGVHAFRCRS